MLLGALAGKEGLAHEAGVGPHQNNAAMTGADHGHDRLRHGDDHVLRTPVPRFGAAQRGTLEPRAILTLPLLAAGQLIGRVTGLVPHTGITAPVPLFCNRLFAVS